MSFFLIIICLAELFECLNVCNHPRLATSGKVIFENSSYRYSQHDMYLQSTSINQPQPAVSTSLVKYTDYLKVEPQFSVRYHSNRVKYFVIFPLAAIRIMGEEYLGYIEPLSGTKIRAEYAILNKTDLFAVKWFLSTEVDGKQSTAEVTCLIHPNGKIVFYYDKVSTEIKYIIWRPLFACEGIIQITTPETWINSGTMVEYELIGDHCPKYTSPKACKNATTLNITCFWCDNANICIESTDRDAHNMKVNKCRVMHDPDVNELSTQTPTKHIETTSSAGEFPVTGSPKETTEETNQHSNTTTEENVEKKSHPYLYIVIPLVIIFFVICVGLIIWRWLHQRK